ncbi:MAG: FAD-binding oxidoreductase [Planctomycetes bacterium]|nr:FAD-binding oxidoreductase [Planctomycetota bacterium]
MDVDFLVIGAGLAGAATAYQLRRRLGAAQAGTDKRILVVEKEMQPGVHSSGRNAAQIRRQNDDPAVAELIRRGADVLATGELAEFRRTGSVLVGLGDDDASAHFSPARGRGLWCPDDGIIDVAALLESYLRGQEVLYGVEVLGWDEPQSIGAGTSRPLRVRTNRTEINAQVVINAAGPWAGTLGRLPLTPMNRHLFMTPPMDRIDPDWPFVWDVVNGYYLRPESGGLLLCACDEQPAPPGQYDEDPAVALRLEDLIHRHQPGLGELRIMRSWVGQRTFAPDRRLVIGFDARDRRVFHVAALGGNGVATSLAIGALAADLLLGSNEPGSNPFDPARLRLG